MRTALLTVALLALSAQPAMAIIGGPGHGNGGGGNNNQKIGVVRVVNGSDQEVEVSANGSTFTSLLPNGGFQEYSVFASNKTDVTVSARLPGIPESLASQTATVQASKTTVATVSVSGQTVSIAVGKPGNVAKLLREAGVALASGGGLLPLLCLGILLGRRPRGRDAASAAGAKSAAYACPLETLLCAGLLTPAQASDRRSP